MTSERNWEDQSHIGNLGMGNLLEDIKLHFYGLSFDLQYLTWVNIEDAFNSYNFRFLSFLQMHIFARKKNPQQCYTMAVG